MASGALTEKVRILVVEDDALTLEALAYLLKAEGYFVLCAHDGKKGLDILQGSAPPRAVLLDLGLPKLDSREFLRRQMQDPKVANIPVIVMTGALSPMVPEAKTVLKKPLDVPRLFGVLSECCGTSRGH